MLKTLEALEAEIDESFSILNHPPKPFVPLIKGPDGKLMLDVLIVGGGMNGLAAAFALRRFGVLNIRQLDAKPAGSPSEGHMGSWGATDPPDGSEQLGEICQSSFAVGGAEEVREEPQRQHHGSTTVYNSDPATKLGCISTPWVARQRVAEPLTHRVKTDSFL